MASIETRAQQLKEIFGDRLRMLATFGNGNHLCAIVQTLTMADLDRCAASSTRWNTGEQGPPLLIPVEELGRALDAFPLELNEIIASRQVIHGDDLLANVNIATEDLRRACEFQARGHLLHLREGYIQASGDRKLIGNLVSASAEPFRSLLSNVARLDGWSRDALIQRLGIADYARTFADALSSAERLVEYVDRWKHA